jgi:hypothetical protein
VGVGVDGALACAAPAMPMYGLHVPTALAIIGIPATNVIAGLPANWIIDLFHLQQRLLKQYHLMCVIY